MRGRLQRWKEGNHCTKKEGRNPKCHGPNDFHPFTHFTVAELQSALAGMRQAALYEYAYQHYSSRLSFLTTSVKGRLRPRSLRK